MNYLALVLGLWCASPVFAADPRPTATPDSAHPAFATTDNCPVTKTGARDDALRITVTRLFPEIHSVSLKVFRPGQPIAMTHGNPICNKLLDLRKTGAAGGVCRVSSREWVPGTYTIVLHVPAEYTRPYRGLIALRKPCEIR